MSLFSRIRDSGDVLGRAAQLQEQVNEDGKRVLLTIGRSLLMEDCSHGNVFKGYCLLSDPSLGERNRSELRGEREWEFEWKKKEFGSSFKVFF